MRISHSDVDRVVSKIAFSFPRKPVDLQLVSHSLVNLALFAVSIPTSFNWPGKAVYLVFVNY